MMNIPYRTRRTLSRVAMISLIVFLVLALIWACWFVWLKRYVIYTRDQGAVLDMSLSAQVQGGEKATAPPEGETISVYYNEGENAINTSRELTQMVGYYADTAALEESISDVLAQAKTLSSGTPVMLDVKSPKGNFFYSSAVSANRHSKIDTAAMDELISYLDNKGMYLIARLPAFRDYHYGLSNTADGLFVASGAYLWADDDYCYWLNPASQGTVTYLVQIVTELKNLGFDEVVFDEFCFPDTDNLKFSGDRAQTLADTAGILASTCTSNNFAVSFIQSPDFALPQGRSRLYLENAAAADAATVAAQTGLADPAIYLVFLTENHDTRYDAYSVLRPLSTVG